MADQVRLLAASRRMSGNVKPHLEHVGDDGIAGSYHPAKYRLRHRGLAQYDVR